MNGYRSGFRKSVVILVATLASLQAAAARPIQKPDPPVFGTGVTLVAVPVFVTDKSGKSVRGLTAEDFEIEDAGQKAPIVAFQAVDADAPVGGTSQAGHTDLPLAIRAESPRQFLLLIDLQFSPESGLSLGRRAAASFVRDTLAPGDLVAVATWGQRGLKVLTGFTADHARVARVLDGSGAVGQVRSDPLGLSGGFEGSGGSGVRDEEFGEQDAVMKNADEGFYRSRVSAFLKDLETLVQRLSILRGRKQIVFLSGGFPEWTWNDPP